MFQQLTPELFVLLTQLSFRAFHGVFKLRLIWTIIASVFVQTYIYSLLTHLLIENVPAVRQFLTQSFFDSGS